MRVATCTEDEVGAAKPQYIYRSLEIYTYIDTENTLMV